MTMADEIAVMAGGRIQQSGSADDLYERPATEFVAGFLGTSNLIDGRLGGTDGELAVFETHDGARLRVPRLRLPASAAGGAPIRAGVRPEKITLVPAGDGLSPAGANVLLGRIAVASYLGVALQYVVHAAGGEELIVVAPNRDEAGAVRLAPGDEVCMTWEPRHTFVVTKERSHDR